jgi:hypothetical protein
MRLSTLALLLLASAVAAVIAIGNRELVAFTLVPFVPRDAGVTFVMPLFLLVFVVFLLGVFAGAVTVALGRARKKEDGRVSGNDSVRAEMTTTGESVTTEPPQS